MLHVDTVRNVSNVTATGARVSGIVGGCLPNGTILAWFRFEIWCTDSRAGDKQRGNNQSVRHRVSKLGSSQWHWQTHRTCAVPTLSNTVCLIVSPAAYLASVREKNEAFMDAPIFSLHSRMAPRICAPVMPLICLLHRKIHTFWGILTLYALILCNRNKQFLGWPKRYFAVMLFIGHCMTLCSVLQLSFSSSLVLDDSEQVVSKKIGWLTNNSRFDLSYKHLANCNAQNELASLCIRKYRGTDATLYVWHSCDGFSPVITRSCSWACFEHRGSRAWIRYMWCSASSSAKTTVRSTQKLFNFFL